MEIEKCEEDERTEYRELRERACCRSASRPHRDEGGNDIESACEKHHTRVRPPGERSERLEIEFEGPQTVGGLHLDADGTTPMDGCLGDRAIECDGRIFVRRGLRDIMTLDLYDSIGKPEPLTYAAPGGKTRIRNRPVGNDEYPGNRPPVVNDRFPQSHARQTKREKRRQVHGPSQSTRTRFHCFAPLGSYGIQKRTENQFMPQPSRIPRTSRQACLRPLHRPRVLCPPFESGRQLPPPAMTRPPGGPASHSGAISS